MTAVEAGSPRPHALCRASPADSRRHENKMNQLVELQTRQLNEMETHLSKCRAALAESRFKAIPPCNMRLKQSNTDTLT